MEIRPLIMAPAGGQEQLLAAVRCGADAVYLGGKHLNARRNAANFEQTDLTQAVSYCHQRDVAVYVAVNTLVLDSERALLEEEAAGIAASGADAVIIQDMAVLGLFARRYPTIKRFASTQTAVHNVDGARFLRDAGFDSVVLARELTLEEIRTIASKVDLPMEAFVHGAHCMSVSGACYLSAMFGGRSGNRGLCAQPCRLDWNCAGRDNALSLKDLSLFSHIKELTDAGVNVLKIEGRMKRPEYVAAAVTACKNAVEGRPYDGETLKAVFSRSGFTDGYLRGKRDREMFGSRTKEDVAGAGKVLGRLASLYREETPRVRLSMEFSLDERRSQLTLTDGNHRVEVFGNGGQAALNRPLSREIAARSLQKTGGTPYEATSLSCSIAPGLTLSAAALNALRREGLDKLTALRGEIHPHLPHEDAPQTAAPTRPSSSQPELWARFRLSHQIPEDAALSRVLLPPEEITPELLSLYGERLICQLPALLFPQDEPAMEKLLLELKMQGLQAVWTNNIYGVFLGKRLGLLVHGGFGLNVTNTDALCAYERQGLGSLTASFELSMAQILRLGGEMKRGAVCYGRLPLMHFRACPVQASMGCGQCGGHGSLTDRMGVVFPVECAQKRFSMLLNSVPLDISGRELSGLDYTMAYFTTETKGEARDVLLRLKANEKTAQPHTAGLYYRELL